MYLMCYWGPRNQRGSFVGEAMDQEALFSLEAAVVTGQVSQVRELPESPCAQENCREVREGLCDSNVNLGVVKAIVIPFKSQCPNQ